ncbi:MAG: hypothetical protein Q9208_006183 [Pyrenodesmia sp. 3 TL-2023]
MSPESIRMEHRRYIIPSSQIQATRELADRALERGEKNRKKKTRFISRKVTLHNTSHLVDHYLVNADDIVDTLLAFVDGSAGTGTIPLASAGIPRQPSHYATLLHTLLQQGADDLGRLHRSGRQDIEGEEDVKAAEEGEEGGGMSKLEAPHKQVLAAISSSWKGDQSLRPRR